MNERICGNCAHWQLTRFSGYGYCKVDAVEPDAGPDSIVLLTAEGGCWNHRDAFEASKDYLMQKEEDAIPEHVRNGIQIGIDCPAFV